jgi:Patatin phospholipase
MPGSSGVSLLRRFTSSFPAKLRANATLINLDATVSRNSSSRLPAASLACRESAVTFARVREARDEAEANWIKCRCQNDGDGSCRLLSGLVSNTPLQWVVDTEPRRDTLAFQVDLWSARGEYPRNIFDVMTRDKEIRYSSRTRASTDQFKYVQKLRHALAGLLKNLPPELKNSPETRLLDTAAEHKVYNIVHLIYRAKNYEGHSKDYEFSRISMQEHWHAGYHDALRTLRHREVLERPTSNEGVLTFDLAEEGRE